MTNRKWVTLHILWDTVSLHLFILWPTECQWYCTFCERFWSHLFLWPIASEWHCPFCEKQSHQIFSTGSEWYCTLCERQSHQIFSYDQQDVSDIAHFVKGSLARSFLMTNSEWVTLHILWKAVSPFLFLWPTASEWYCTSFERQSHHIFPLPTGCKWNCTFCERQSLFLWPTGCERHCIFCIRQSHQMFSYDQQRVSDIAHFVKHCLTISFPMTNRMCVMLHTLWKAVSSHVFLWPTESE